MLLFLARRSFWDFQN